MDEILISQLIRILTDDGLNMSGNHTGLPGRLKKIFSFIIGLIEKEA